MRPRFLPVGLAMAFACFFNLGAIAPSVARPPTSTREAQLRQRDDGWAIDFAVARLLASNGSTSDVVIQANILSKPQTTYANLVYQVFATRGRRWDEIHTNTGSRLVFDEAGSVLLPPEVIPVEELQERLEERFAAAAELEDYEIQVVLTVRYDTWDGERDQRLRFEQETTYDAIAPTRSPNLFVQDGLKGECIQCSDALGHWRAQRLRQVKALIQ